LVEAGYTVELDCWDWAAGENFVTRMHHALDTAGRVVVLFSLAYFDETRYTAHEWLLALVTTLAFAHVVVQAIFAPPIVVTVLVASIGIGKKQYDSCSRG
jgi:hypothetical protein